MKSVQNAHSCLGHIQKQSGVSRQGVLQRGACFPVHTANPFLSQSLPMLASHTKSPNWTPHCGETTSKCRDTKYVVPFFIFIRACAVISLTTLTRTCRFQKTEQPLFRYEKIRVVLLIIDQTGQRKYNDYIVFTANLRTITATRLRKTTGGPTMKTEMFCFQCEAAPVYDNYL